MGATVIVNMRTVVHADSSGKAISAPPDVCKTPAPPGPPVPVPYPIISKSSDTTSGSKKVKCDGKSIMLKGSKFGSCKGDEAGTIKGIVSSTNMSVAKFVVYSFDVKVEGKNVPRLGDSMTMNGNGPNTMTPAELQSAAKALGIEAEIKYLCKIVCEEAKKSGYRSNRATARLKKQRKYPNIKAEVPFKGCRPDFVIMAGGAVLAVGDFKWIVSKDRFRGKQLKNMKRIKRKFKKILVLNEKACQC